MRDVDLHLAAGTHLGVVGRPAAARPRLGRLLARFRDADAGRVRIGGIDVADLRWRRSGAGWRS